MSSVPVQNNLQRIRLSNPSCYLFMPATEVAAERRLCRPKSAYADFSESAKADFLAEGLPAATLVAGRRAC